MMKGNVKIWLGVNENKDENVFLIQDSRPQGISFNDEKLAPGMVFLGGSTSSSVPSPVGWLPLLVTTWLPQLQLHLLIPPPATGIKEQTGLVSLLKETQTSQTFPVILRAHA